MTTPFSAGWIKEQWAAVEGDGEPTPTATDELIRQWHDEAAQLDAQAAQARTTDGGRFQIHGWETRAQALRDCATELWQVATGEIVLKEDWRAWCLPGCDRLDGHDGRDTGACMKNGTAFLAKRKENMP